MNNRISVIFGTRPEAIKLAPLIFALRNCDALECHVCVTAQHRDLLDQVLGAFGIEPDVDLDLMRADQTLTELTSRAMTSVDRYLGSARPGLVLVQGDTTTVLASALAAFYRGIPVGHVEAGLRTWNFHAPWPEEANRVLTSRMATLHFAPTETNRRNLLDEGVPPERVFVTGNTGIDALFLALERIHANPPTVPGLEQLFAADWRNVPVVLITGHRRESHGENLHSICSAVADLARAFPGVHFVYPVHPNPNVRDVVREVLGASGHRTTNIHLVEPIPYLPFIALMERATLILTDSGGVQEEAPSLGKPVVVTRSTTERPEAVSAGCATLVGASRASICREVERLLSDAEYYRSKSTLANPYGDGTAAQRITKVVVSHLAAEKHSTDTGTLAPSEMP